MEKPNRLLAGQEILPRETSLDEAQTRNDSASRANVQPHEDLSNVNVKVPHPSLDADARWREITSHAQGKIGQSAAQEGHNDPRSRWKRAVFLANILANGRGIITGGPMTRHASPQAKRTKVLETQHWLELIDGKHRYGSNLKYYHKTWNDADTKENFFYWLDIGEGREVDLPACPRDKLEKERIIYLSAEQRLNYLTKIDNDGKLRWSRNNEFVDTTPNRWKDAGHGKGIIPTDGTEDDRHDTNIERRQSFQSFERFSSSDNSSDEEAEARHYGMTEKVLRKTVSKNTWIYACDLNYNVFVGIKETGVFQHSSFFPGAVASAGLLTVKNGLVTSFSPLSGHYRTSISHFREFISAMDERGLDLHKVEITKAEGILWGLEHYGKFKKAEHRFVESRKHAIQHGLERVVSAVFPGHRTQLGKPRKGKAPGSVAGPLGSKTAENLGADADAQVNKKTMASQGAPTSADTKDLARSPE